MTLYAMLCHGFISKPKWLFTNPTYSFFLLYNFTGMILFNADSKSISNIIYCIYCFSSQYFITFIIISFLEFYSVAIEN